MDEELQYAGKRTQRAVPMNEEKEPKMDMDTNILRFRMLTYIN